MVNSLNLSCICAIIRGFNCPFVDQRGGEFTNEGREKGFRFDEISRIKSLKTYSRRNVQRRVKAGFGRFDVQFGRCKFIFGLLYIRSVFQEVGRDARINGLRNKLIKGLLIPLNRLRESSNEVVYSIFCFCDLLLDIILHTLGFQYLGFKSFDGKFIGSRIFLQIIYHDKCIVLNLYILIDNQEFVVQRQEFIIRICNFSDQVSYHKVFAFHAGKIPLQLRFGRIVEFTPDICFPLCLYTNSKIKWRFRHFASGFDFRILFHRSNVCVATNFVDPGANFYTYGR
ncbi:hypothetical protein D3C72_1426200 [compost metagenome]